MDLFLLFETKFEIHQRALKTLNQICFVTVYACFVLIGAGCDDSR